MWQEPATPHWLFFPQTTTPSPVSVTCPTLQWLCAPLVPLAQQSQAVCAVVWAMMAEQPRGLVTPATGMLALVCGWWVRREAKDSSRWDGNTSWQCEGCTRCAKALLQIGHDFFLSNSYNRHWGHQYTTLPSHTSEIFSLCFGHPVQSCLS